MERKCVIPGCFSSGDKDNFFMFPLNNRELLNNWILQMPFLEFTELDLNECLVCEKHFEDHKIVRENGYIRGLMPDAVPSLFQLPTAKPYHQEPEPQNIILPPMQNQNIEPLHESDLIDTKLEQVPEPAPIPSEQYHEPIHENEEQADEEEMDDSTYSCRFCLKSIDDVDESVLIDNALRKHYKNLTSTELQSDFNYSEVSCQKCAVDIKRSSIIKTRVLINQKKLVEMVEQKHNSNFTIKQEVDDDFFYNEDNLEVTLQESYLKEESGDERKEYSSKRERKHRERHRHRDKSHSHRREMSNDNETDHEKKKRLQRKYDHAKEKILCTDCGQYFSRGSIRFHHLRIHIKTPKFQCDLCDKFFYRKEECRNHMKTHIKVRTKDVSCHLCAKQFSDTKNLKMHIKKFHLKIGNICCELCGKSFTNIVNYQNHMRSTHTLERAFKCDECECSYFSKGDLVDHKNRCHSNEPALCTVCNKIFSSKVALRNHTKRIHAEHTFVCTFEACGKKFVNNHLLQKHQKVHLGLKDHECQLCGMRYYRNFDLKRHILNIHMKVKISCEMPGCKSLFARKETYRNHILTHHKDIGEENVQIMLLKIRNMQLPKPQLDNPVEME